MGRFLDAEPFKIDRNGTKYYHDYTCPRCGGAGIIPHFQHVDGGTCFECGGSGRSDDHPYKVYTPEYLKKLEEQRAKREAKRIAKAKEDAPERNKSFLEYHGFNENGETFVILGDTYPIKEELKAAGCKFDYILGWHSPEDLKDRQTMKLLAEEVYEKNLVDTFIDTVEKDDEIKARIKAANDELAKKNDTSDFVGEVGKRMELTLTLDHTSSYETNSYGGYGSSVTMMVYSFTDEHGNVLVWKTSGYLDKIVDNTCVSIEDGETFKCKATIKEHNVYRNKKQTVLQRLKVIA